VTTGAGSARRLPPRSVKAHSSSRSSSRGGVPGPARRAAWTGAAPRALWATPRRAPLAHPPTHVVPGSGALASGATLADVLGLPDGLLQGAGVLMRGNGWRGRAAGWALVTPGGAHAPETRRARGLARRSRRALAHWEHGSILSRLAHAEGRGGAALARHLLPKRGRVQAPGAWRCPGVHRPLSRRDCLTGSTRASTMRGAGRATRAEAARAGWRTARVERSCIVPDWVRRVALGE
jgi:hypothetical protein